MKKAVRRVRLDCFWKHAEVLRFTLLIKIGGLEIYPTEKSVSKFILLAKIRLDLIQKIMVTLPN